MFYPQVRWAPCHLGMTRPQVAGGGDALKLWRAAANILNKQSRTADKDGPPAWRLDVGLKIRLLRKTTRSLGPGRIVCINGISESIFRPKRDEVTGGWRKLHNEELHNLYSSPSIIRMIK
jgi:hypothetical protein